MGNYGLKMGCYGFHGAHVSLCKSSINFEWISRNVEVRNVSYVNQNTLAQKECNESNA